MHLDDCLRYCPGLQIKPWGHYTKIMQQPSRSSLLSHKLHSTPKSVTVLTLESARSFCVLSEIPSMQNHDSAQDAGCSGTNLAVRPTVVYKRRKTLIVYVRRRKSVCNVPKEEQNLATKEQGAKVDPSPAYLAADGNQKGGLDLICAESNHTWVLFNLVVWRGVSTLILWCVFRYYWYEIK